MDQTHNLTRHRDVQNWITDRKGLPAIRRVTDPTSGAMRSRLAIRFNHTQERPEAASVDDGMMPVSWAAWLAEFDRQGLMLKVDNTQQFEFVARRNLQ